MTENDISSDALIILQQDGRPVVIPPVIEKMLRCVLAAIPDVVGKRDGKLEIHYRNHGSKVYAQAHNHVKIIVDDDM